MSILSSVSLIQWKYLFSLYDESVIMIPKDITQWANLIIHKILSLIHI